MNQKRNRSINWDEEEKQLLQSVLKDFTQIIENKSLDTNTSKQKTKAWEEVCKTFNQLNSRRRELNQIKIQWKTMKINARKTLSHFKKEVNRTGGGARPPSPDASILDMKDLLNPAELLRDHNEFDSDGVVLEEFEFATPSETYLLHQNTSIGTIEEVDAQVSAQDLTPIVITQDNGKESIPLEPMDILPVKNPIVDTTVGTPISRSVGTISAKKGPKRKLINLVGNNGPKPKQHHDDYVSSMLMHSKMLKDDEHLRRMEMAEEEHSIKMQEHSIKMQIQKEKLKSAILEREILEFRKMKELSSSNN